MEEEQPNTEETPDEGDAVETAEAATHEGDPSETAEVATREQRIADYVTQSLEISDPFQANVGVVNAELAEITPSVDSYLRLVKQMDRVSQLAMKLKAANASP